MEYKVRRLLVRKWSPAVPETTMRAWVHFPRSKLWVEMAVRRRENHCEEDECEDDEKELQREVKWR